MKRLLPMLLPLFALLGGFTCGEPPPPAPVHDLTLVMRWNKAYETETWFAVREGLRWSFSFLGATLPKGSFDKAVPVADSLPFRIDLKTLGFSEPAQAALAVICDSIRSSPEYQRDQSIDLSRFVVLTLGSSWHYYRITGVATTLNEFIERHHLEQPQQFGVTQSAVAKHHRLLQFGTDTSDMLSAGFLAVEGRGDLQKGTFVADAYEAFDILPNGQLRFAVYDVKGNLIAGSPTAHGAAGKPAKCLWCHEIVISPLFVPNTPVPGLMSNETFHFWRDAFQRQLARYRDTLNDDLDYSKRQDHTYAELLYISFMEPSLLRLSQEWNLSTAAAEQRIGKRETHVYDEFPFIGNLYYRYHADSAAGINALRVPLSVREPLGDAIDYFGRNK